VSPPKKCRQGRTAPPPAPLSYATAVECDVQPRLCTPYFVLAFNYNSEFLPFCLQPKYLGVTLDKSLTYRRHLESLRKKLT